MSDAPSAWKIEQAMAVWSSVRARLLTEDPSLEHDEAALTELLGPAEGDVNDALDRILRAMVHAEAMETAAAEQAKKIAARSKRYEARGNSLRGLAFAMMEALGKRKHEMPELTAAIRRGKQGVHIIDLDAIPDIYVETVSERKPDKATILADLRAGRDVPGAQIGNGMDYLAITLS